MPLWMVRATAPSNCVCSSKAEMMSRPGMASSGATALLGHAAKRMRHARRARQHVPRRREAGSPLPSGGQQVLFNGVPPQTDGNDPDTITPDSIHETDEMGGMSDNGGEHGHITEDLYEADESATTRRPVSKFPGRLPSCLCSFLPPLRINHALYSVIVLEKRLISDC